MSHGSLIVMTTIIAKVMRAGIRVGYTGPDDTRGGGGRGKEENRKTEKGKAKMQQQQQPLTCTGLLL